uniref:Uncharacterized protein n=1 Tax=Spironucleus salmonicida TaxID=348837 RepID=V6LIV9_9EUKA|eukprot:EST44258.1 Hypothetical protein SS50377_15920 [Spironucleus salmonicida]
MKGSTALRNTDRASWNAARKASSAGTKPPVSQRPGSRPRSASWDRTKSWIARSVWATSPSRCTPKKTSRKYFRCSGARLELTLRFRAALPASSRQDPSRSSSASGTRWRRQSKARARGNFCATTWICSARVRNAAAQAVLPRHVLVGLLDLQHGPPLVAGLEARPVHAAALQARVAHEAHQLRLLVGGPAKSEIL